MFLDGFWLNLELFLCADRNILFQMGVVGKEVGENLLTLIQTIKWTRMIQTMTVER